MGCASAIALGVALNSKKKILVIDGDGALLMKMGNMSTIGANQPKNLIHIFSSFLWQSSLDNKKYSVRKIYE